MKTQYFKVGGDNHMIDRGGNHFVNGVCVNPIDGEGNIGDTHPKQADRQPAITVTGFVPHTFVEDKNGKLVFKQLN